MLFAAAHSNRYIANKAVVVVVSFQNLFLDRIAVNSVYLRQRYRTLNIYFNIAQKKNNIFRFPSIQRNSLKFGKCLTLLSLVKCLSEKKMNAMFHLPWCVMKNLRRQTHAKQCQYSMYKVRKVSVVCPWIFFHHISSHLMSKPNWLAVKRRPRKI